MYAFLCVAVAGCLLAPRTSALTGPHSALTGPHSALTGPHSALSHPASLQGDLLTALSYALLNVEPRSMLLHSAANCSTSLGEDGAVRHLRGEEESAGAPRRRRKRAITFQGLRPVIKVDLRFLKANLFEVYKGTHVSMYFGTGVKAYLDDLLGLMGSRRRSVDDSVLDGLEDLVSMTGVDGPSCVHRLFCELGAGPGLEAGGLFGEMLELGLSFVSRQGAPANELGGRGDDGRRYLDAVGAGRGGADCAALYDTCPLSLLALLRDAHQS